MNRPADHQRELQAEQDLKDQVQTKEEPKPLQAGDREQPVQLPAQHIKKPGLESELLLAPNFQGPTYKGSEKLKDKVAIITGGDSGIGRAVAVLFAREGADVAVAYLEEETDAKETKRLVEAEGRRCLLLQGDVKNAAFCKAAVEETVKQLGKLNVVINNAAFQLHASTISDITVPRLNETFHTNIYSCFYMVQAALPHLKEGDCIINTSSVTGLRGSGHLIDYASTKGAMNAFTKSLARNLLPKGIRVNAVAPGPVWTPLNPADAQPEKVATFGQDTDLMRAAQPEEISPAFVFLASPTTSSYITGIVLPITGSVEAI